MKEKLPVAESREKYKDMQDYFDTHREILARAGDHNIPEELRKKMEELAGSNMKVGDDITYVKYNRLSN